MSDRRGERGVSAMEALVALALIAILLIPLLDLQTRIARGAVVQERASRHLEARQNALVLLRTVNVSATPVGAIPLGPGVAMRWSASPLSDETRSRAYPSGDGDFMVRLYRVTVTIDGPGTEGRFTVERLGWTPIDEDEANRRGRTAPSGSRSTR